MSTYVIASTLLHGSFPLPTWPPAEAVVPMALGLKEALPELGALPTASLAAEVLQIRHELVESMLKV